MLEILSSDLHSRITFFEVNNKKILTPTLVPVVDPRDNIITPHEMKHTFGFNFLITSSYLYLKRYGMPTIQSPTIHQTLDFDGIVMMDSGAYQILAYGDVSISPLQSLELQSLVQTDIGVILDVPTPPSDSFAEAKNKVEQTIERIELSLDHVKTHDKTLWTLPIQGGKNVSLIDNYIQKVKEKNYLDYFSFYALGSVVPIMASYDYTTLFSMIHHARSNLPYHIPLHIFGAGHPMIFPFIVALGGDTFDSAAYILFAKDNRYMTSTGTLILDNIQEFPCDCEVCSKYTPQELRESPHNVRIRALAAHNLHISSTEIKLIREAIRNGNLWELLEQRALSHPNLYQAFHVLTDLSKKGFFDIGTPITKSGGLKIYNHLSFDRPEFKIIRERILKNHQKNSESLYIYLLSGEKTPIELFNLNPELKDKLIEHLPSADVSLFLPFFGVFPFELHETYPFSQFVFSNVIDSIILEKAIEVTINYIIEKGYSKIIILPAERKEKLNSIRDKLQDKLQMLDKVELNVYTSKEKSEED
ncbi:MAG: tRNA guanosine(15) transglycosylase TgtA [Candidatus Heimdallarchaeaceae archaeon]